MRKVIKKGWRSNREEMRKVNEKCRRQSEGGEKMRKVSKKGWRLSGEKMRKVSRKGWR